MVLAGELEMSVVEVSVAHLREQFGACLHAGEHVAHGLVAMGTEDELPVGPDAPVVVEIRPSVCASCPEQPHLKLITQVSEVNEVNEVKEVKGRCHWDVVYFSAPESADRKTIVL